MRIKNSFIIVLFLILLNCSSKTKCINYGESISSIREPRVLSLTIYIKYSELKMTDTVTVVGDADYKNYLKIGEVEIVCPIDCSDLQQRLSNRLLSVDVKKFQEKDIDIRFNNVKHSINEIVKNIAIKNGANGVYLTSMTSDLSDGFDKNASEVRIIAGCMNYIFCRYDLLIRN